MKSVVLTIEDLRKIVHDVGLAELMDEFIRRLTHAFECYEHDVFRTPARDGLQYQTPHYGLLEWMPTLELAQQISIKHVGYHPHNPTLHQTSTILSTIQSFDPATGHLTGIMDATLLTALRTGAASAIMSEHLALPESTTIGIIGAGAQAVTQLHALSRRFSIEQVVVYDTHRDHADSLASRTPFLDAPHRVVARHDLPDLLRSVDILCTCTSAEPGEGPVVPDGEHRPWLHINAVGSDFIGKTELPLSLLQRSTVCPDFLAQAKKEGECQQLDDNEIGPGIVELLKHPGRYAAMKETLTVFDSTGWALEDHIGLNILSAYAREMKLGLEVEIELTSPDALDPYSAFESVTGTSPSPVPALAKDIVS